MQDEFVLLLLLATELLPDSWIDSMVGANGLLQLMYLFLLIDFLACHLAVFRIYFQVNIDVDVAGGMLASALFLIHVSIQMIQIDN